MRVGYFALFQILQRARTLVVPELEELLDAMRVPAAVERRLEENLEHPLDHLPAGKAFRKRDNVGVVVAASQLGGVGLVDGSTANARHLVRGHCDSQARTADDYAALRLTRRDGLSNGVTILRVVDRRGIVRSKIQHVVTTVTQNFYDAILVFETGVIGAKGDLHSCIEPPTPMKLACASGAFDRAIRSNELTQLEFLELCAHQLACDGVVLDARHFPRGDDDYLAQIKKLAADWGLSIAALNEARFFSAAPEEMEASLVRARTLGAPLLAAPLGRLFDGSWSDQLERLNAATSLAKVYNITLAVRNAPDTFAVGTHDYRRVAKEADSAWLRYGPELEGLEPGSDVSSLRGNTVLLWSDAATQNERSMRAVATTFQSFLGFLVLDDREGAARTEVIAAGIRQWRIMLAPAAK